MTDKPTKTREELAAVITARLKEIPVSRAVTGVVIAPVLKPGPNYPNWHAAFTTRSREAVPRIAWHIGSQIADEFDMA